MHNNINNMKTNIETNTHSDNNPASPAPRRPATGLKAVVVILSIAALCLSYRAANEAVALYGVLEKVHDAMAQEQQLKSHVTADQRISETIPPLAGL